MYSSTAGLTKNINELQSDVLTEKLSDNPYMKYHVIIEKNKQLNTTSKNIVGAINEVLRKTNTASTTNKAALAELYNVLGHVGVQPELTKKVLAQAPSLIQLVLDMLDRIDSNDALRTVSTKDQYTVRETRQDSFRLSHKPRNEEIKVFINGVQYSNVHTTAFTYDQDQNLVIWQFTEANGGFDIVDSEVVIEYQYDLKKEIEDLNGTEGGE